MGKINFDDLLKSAPTEAGSFQHIETSDKAGDDKGSDSYFSKKEYISRSDLYNLTNPKESYEPAYRQGSIFDAFFTEPELFVTKYRDSISDFELLQLIRAKEAVRELKVFGNDFFKWHDSVLQGFPFAKPPKHIKLQRERYRESFEPVKGIKIKARAKYDFLIESGGKKIIIDLKSTTKPTLQEFVSDIKGHNLDTQAGWYTDIEQADEYWLLVVSYQSANSLKKALIGHVKDSLVAVQKPLAWFFPVQESRLKAGRAKYQKLVVNLRKSGKI